MQNNITTFLDDAGNVEEFAHRYFEYLASLLAQLDTSAIAKFIKELEVARQEDRTVFVVGNGGSASTASHLATDFSWGTRMGQEPGRARVMALTDNAALLTAVANDTAYADIFVSQLRMLYRPGDVLIVISASGSSPNVVRAAEWVKAQGGKVLGLLGFDGGVSKELCDVAVHVRTPKGEYGPVEDIHLMLEHVMTAWLRRRAETAHPPRKSVAARS